MSCVARAEELNTINLHKKLHYTAAFEEKKKHILSAVVTEHFGGRNTNSAFCLLNVKEIVSRGECIFEGFSLQ
jgi:hypothetical protein